MHIHVDFTQYFLPQELHLFGVIAFVRVVISKMPSPATSRLILEECTGFKHVNAFSQNVNIPFFLEKL